MLGWNVRVTSIWTHSVGAARWPWQASAGSSGSSGSCQWFYYSIREFSPIRRSRISRLTWLPFLPMCAISDTYSKGSFINYVVSKLAIFDPLLIVFLLCEIDIFWPWNSLRLLFWQKGGGMCVPSLPLHFHHPCFVVPVFSIKTKELKFSKSRETTLVFIVCVRMFDRVYNQHK